MESPITFCLSTHNNLPYLMLAVDSVRRCSYYRNAPFVIHAENCTDGTNEWLEQNKDVYNLTLLIEPNNPAVRGIGGGMNVAASMVTTEYIMFLHSDFYVSEDWDIECLKVLESNGDKPTWVFSYRIQPDMFNEDSRYGTVIVPKDMFGAYHYDFNYQTFLRWAKDLRELNKDISYRKTEGVSGLIRKTDWDRIGGNDDIFAPASWEDQDLFLRMALEGYEFILTSNSVVWHFGARGSHRLEENAGYTDQRQIVAERNNIQKWINKWGQLPTFDEYGTIIHEPFREKYNTLYETTKN